MKASKPIGLEAVDVVPVHEIVYARLTRALMAGQIKPGQKLTSRKIAQEFGVSDMPVRAALSRLQALKALTPLANGSLVLPPMTRARFDDLTRTRLICEGAATETAVPLMSKPDMRALAREQAALVKAARAEDIDGYLLHNHQFKFGVYRASQSPSLLFLIETVWLQTGPFLHEFSGRFAGTLSGILALDHHDDVLAALSRGDGPAAARAMQADIAEGAEFLRVHADFADPR